MSSKKQLLAQFDLNNVLYNNSLVGITEAEANKSVLEPMNTIKWIAGHALWAQRNLAKMARVELDIPWLQDFARGSKVTDISKMPTLEEIKTKWNQMHPQIKNGLEAMPDEALDAKIEADLPITVFDNSLAGMWTFINSHQAYTIGQLSILRRGYNKEPMSFYGGN